MSFDKLLILLRGLATQRVDYVLIGRVALNLHGILRATEDIDLFIKPQGQNIERLKNALRAVWNDPDIEEIKAADLTGRYATVRYGPPDEDFLWDLSARLFPQVASRGVQKFHTLEAADHERLLRTANRPMLSRGKR